MIALNRSVFTHFVLIAAFACIALPAAAQDPAFDDFERGTLGNNWRVAFGGSSVGITGGSVGLVAGPERFGIVERHNASYNADQFSQGVIASNRPDSVLTQVFVRRRASDAARYGFHWDDRTTAWQIKYDGVPTAQTRILASKPGAAPRRGDTLRLEVVGRTLRGLVNGEELLVAIDSSATAIDEAGQPGMAFRFTISVAAMYPAPVFGQWFGGSLARADIVRSTTITVDNSRARQRFEGFGATTLSLVYGLKDYLTPTMRARAIEAVYGEVGLTMGQVEPGIMETPANATDTWNQRRNDNDDPFTINPAGFNWIANDAMMAKVIAPGAVYGLDNWSLANKINTSGVLSYLEPFRTSNYERYLDEIAEYTVAGLIHWRDVLGTLPRWVAPWNEPTSGNREITGATTQTLVDLVKRIGRRMADSGFGAIKLVVPNEETVQRSYDVARAMLEDAEARRYIGAIGYHAYPYESPYSSVRQILEQSGRGRPVASQIAIRQRLRDLGAQYGVPVWLTEISEGPGNSDFAFGVFDNVRARAIHIHDEFLYAGASAFYGMNAMWDRRSHEEHFAGRGVDFFSESSAIALVDLDSVYISGIGYAIGHYARWLNRGSEVLESNSSDSLVQVSAFRNDTTGKLVLVLINNANAERPVGIRVQELRLSGSMTGEQSTVLSRWRPIEARTITTSDSMSITLPAESVTTVAVGYVGPFGSASSESANRLMLGIALRPMPARTVATVTYTLPSAGSARLWLINSAGEKVWSYWSDFVDVGSHEASIDVSAFASGAYRLVLQTPWGSRSYSVPIVR